MMNMKRWRRGLLASLSTLFMCSSAMAQTVVSSFAELKPYLDDDNVHIVMTPGTYRITPADCGSSGSGLFPVAPLLNFTGTNTLFDFTGVTFEIETEVFQSFGNVDVKEIAVFGEDQVLKNLTMIDIGNTRPRRTALGLVLDGQRNRVEGFNMTIRGSQPYGYGDIFGKGSGYVIKHYKHSAILVRGEDNHLLNCKVFHRAYGHGIFCQGSQNAVIEGCYVEGEVRSSDDVLAEEGSGSSADNVDFITNWGEDENGENGYRLQPGWMFSCQEDGIRAYNTGPGLDGETSVNTTDMRVIDCTVKNMRSGVTIGFCNDMKYVENCVAIGVENGYWVGTYGEVVGCAGNAQFGPLLENNYQTDRDSVVELTVLDSKERYGNEILAYTGGTRHHITLRSRDKYVDQNLRIMIAGIREGLRQFVVNPKYNDFTASDTDLFNYTHYPVEMNPKSAGTSGQTGGSVTDSGSGNSLTPISASTDGGFGVIQSIEAEDFSTGSGVSIQTRGEGVRFVRAGADGDYIRCNNFFFGSGPNRFEAFVAGGASAGSIEIRLGGVDGELIGTCPVAAGDGSWVAETITLEEPRGKHDVYFVFKGVPESLPQLDRFRFYVTFPGHEMSNGLVGHWTFDEAAGVMAKDSSGYGHHGTVTDAAWTNGKKHGALNFNGSTSVVNVPAAAFETIRTEITIALWIHGDPLQPLADSVFYAVDSSNDRVLNIHLPYDNDGVYWDAGNDGGYDRINKTASAADYKGSWNHWVFTKNTKTGNMRIYLNGALWHAGVGTTREITGIVSAAIGNQLTELSYDGLIDDVRLYDVNLMEHEVAELYESFSFADGGAPHAWLDSYGLVSGGDYEAAALLDSDDDGLLNGEEFTAGTDPTNNASVLRLTGAAPLGDEVVIDWSAVSGKTYDLWSKDSLMHDAWTLHAADIPGFEPSCVSTVQTDGASGFIRVDVQP